MNFDTDLNDGKLMEQKVFKLLNCDGIVTQGKYGHDIIVNKEGATKTIEVKYSREPLKYIAVEMFNLYTMEPTCLASSKADYWINVIAEKPTFDKATVWVTKTQSYRNRVKELFKSGKAISSIGGDFNSFVYINVLIDDVKAISKYLGEI